MNEKLINELAVEAKLIVTEYNGFDLTKLSVSHKIFAMLIIKECARIVDNLTEQDNPIEYRNSYARGADVLEHFGVNK
jgi:hypothetical protein